MLAVLGAAVLIAVGALVWSLRSGPSAPDVAPANAKPIASKGGSADSPTLGDRSANVAPGAETSAPEAPPVPADQLPELSVEERSTTEMEVMLARDIPRRLREWVASCYNDGFSYKSLEDEQHRIGIEYTLVRRGGVFSLEDVKLTESIGKPDLEECIVTTAGDLSWREPGTASYRVPMADELTLLSLKKFGEPLPHELEDEAAQQRDFDEEFGAKVKK